MSTESMNSKGFQTAWLDSAGFDSLFIFGVLALALVSGAIVTYQPDLFLPVMMADLWLLGYHHVISTFTKLAGTKEDRKQNWNLIVPLPIVVMVCVGLLASTMGIWTIITVYFFWQWFHYVRQAWGVSAFYKRKAGLKPPARPKLDEAAFWMIPLWGILNRCSQGWDEFLFLPVWMPDIPVVIVNIVAACALASLGYWAYNRYRNYREGHLSIGLTAFELSYFAAFFVGYVVIDDINSGWLVANIWHNAQYIMFVWLYNTNRFKYTDQDQKGVIAWLSQKTVPRTILYFAFCLIVTTLFYRSVQTLLSHVSAGEVATLVALNIITFQTLNFHHYVVDGLIWKARNKKNQKVMKIN